MSRTWIVYMKPKQASYTHAGMVMGLGLTSEHLTPAVYKPKILLSQSYALHSNFLGRALSFATLMMSS
jgi:hypothetical protein